MQVLYTALHTIHLVLDEENLFDKQKIISSILVTLIFGSMPIRWGMISYWSVLEVYHLEKIPSPGNSYPQLNVEGEEAF